MIIVIQCAARKSPDAGHLKTRSGKSVFFVAQPETAPRKPNFLYARPDDLSDTGSSWRQVLLDYNNQPAQNPLGLLPAYRLYENRTYERLVERFGLQQVFIMSAGWGLIRGDFLTPNYDITFSQNADSFKKRKNTYQCEDLNMLPTKVEDEIVFIGGKDYLPLFASCTRSILNKKTVFHNLSRPPVMDGYNVKRFETRTRTNWHYECANSLINGTLKL